MEIAKNPEFCCGCMACAQVCPYGAVSETRNEKGFLVPDVDEDKCFRCGACERVCPANDLNAATECSTQRIYGGCLKSDKARSESQSGGAFTSFAEVILKSGGVVYGVEMENGSLTVQYARVDSIGELNRLKGSKYVQAYTGNIFSKVRRDLQDGKAVLFGGTPCYVDGLLHFVPEGERERLVTCDLVCHGTPSPAIFGDYIDYLRTIHCGEISHFKFRDKDKGWHSNIESYDIVGAGKEYSRLYAEFFYSEMIHRENCYHCKYTSYERVGDLTVGDFWGIEKTHPECNDEKGYSLILVNSVKGEAVFEKAKEKLNWFESDRESCTQPALQHPWERSKKTDSFWRDYRKKGFMYVARKYTSLNKRRQLWRKIKDAVKPVIKAFAGAE